MGRREESLKEAYRAFVCGTPFGTFDNSKSSEDLARKVGRAEADARWSARGADYEYPPPSSDTITRLLMMDKKYDNHVAQARLLDAAELDARLHCARDVPDAAAGSSTPHCVPATAETVAVLLQRILKRAYDERAYDAARGDVTHALALATAGNDDAAPCEHLAELWVWEGLFLHAAHRLDRAADTFDRALALIRSSAESGASDALDDATRERICATLVRKAAVLADQHKFEGAAEALEQRRILVGPSP